MKIKTLLIFFTMMFCISALADAQTIFTDSVHIVSCNNGSDGYWEIMPIGPNHPYLAEFSTGDSMSTDSVAALYITNLAAGNYSCVITGSDLQQYYFDLTILQPLQITVGLTDIVHVKCYGDSTGSIVPGDVHGGSPPYSYQWSNSETTLGIAGIPAGIYHLVITDSLGCTTTATYEVRQPEEPMKFFATIKNTSCKQRDDGAIMLYQENIYNSTGTNHLLIFDSFGNFIDSLNIGEDMQALAAGLYQGVLENENGCAVTDLLYVQQGPEDCIFIPNYITANGDMHNDVFSVGGACDYDEFQLLIYNDYGDKVFETDDCNFTWDPLNNYKAVANTVFYCYIEVTKDGQTYKYTSSINVNY